MFIDFEGIDGSGKTTISNYVAKALRGLGHRVAHAREGGELQTAVARRVRELTRDSALLEMGSRAELFLNLARDAQQVEEIIRPALTRGEVCISDRYLYSQLALSGGARGLSANAVQSCLQLASQDIWPDLVVLVDVDPELALVRVIQLATAQDVGNLLNPTAALGQIEGGIAQGVGLAVMEEILLVDGKPRNPSFTDYLIPTALDMPEVLVDWIELPEPDAPFGAKGIGEPPVISSTPAVVAAIRQATGMPLVRVPVRPGDIVGLSS